MANSWLKYLLFFMVSPIGCQPLPPAPLPPTAEPQATITPAPAGHLAYIGGDGNIYVVPADLSQKIAVTQDATAPWEGMGRSYQRLAWAPDGHLAYAAVSRAGDRATSKLYVAESPTGPARLVGESEAHFVIYIYWSPVPCQPGGTCRRLAYLIEDQAEISLRLVSLVDGQVANDIIGFGWPYYFSWAPDGRSMLWHTGGGEVGRSPAQLALYHLESGRTEPLAHPPAAFLAPAWSPQTPLWLGAIRQAGTAYLQIMGQAEPVRLAALTGAATFAWSPDGRFIAFAMDRRTPGLVYGPIHLYDTRTGRTSRLTAVGHQILAFFWDPTGQRLAYLTHLALPETERMQWRVYDVAPGQDRGFKTFRPSLQMKFIMASFNQYAQSHRFWSPDGRYLVYADRDNRAEERVWLIDTRSEDGYNARLVDKGTMGFWSWQ
jgi:TolB protein